MQTAVLLNNFERANKPLDGRDGAASKYGTIHDYEDSDIEKWCGGLKAVQSIKKAEKMIF